MPVDVGEVHMGPDEEDIDDVGVDEEDIDDVGIDEEGGVDVDVDLDGGGQEVVVDEDPVRVDLEYLGVVKPRVPAVPQGTRCRKVHGSFLVVVESGASSPAVARAPTDTDETGPVGPHRDSTTELRPVHGTSPVGAKWDSRGTPPPAPELESRDDGSTADPGRTGGPGPKRLS